MRHRFYACLLLLPWPLPAGAQTLESARATLFKLPPDGKASAVVALPVDDGKLADFTLADSRTLPRDLMRRFPAIRSFRGSDDAGRTLRLDYASGIARMSLRDAQGAWLPIRSVPVAAESSAPILPAPVATPPSGSGDDDPRGAGAHGNIRYEFRLALAAGSVFVARHGSTPEAALGAAAHLANRANEVLENDLGVHVTLAAHNERLMITDAEGDPLRHGEPRPAAATLISRRLSASSYDIGHALLGLEGGETDTGTSCSNAMDADYLATHKAAAWSGGADDDAALANFLLVIANQLGAPFRENRCAGCLAYDGASIARVRTWLGSRGGRCAKKAIVEATAPWIDPEPFAEPIALPARTPFWLDAAVEATMPGRRLSYAWDDIDALPRFRALGPASNTRREFTSQLPAESRQARFRLTVRDNGGETATVASEDAQVQFIDTGRAFAVETPGDGVAGQPLALRWDPAGTTLEPISCHFLDASLSRDGGATWHVIAKDLQNTGSASVHLPDDTATDDARLRLSCDWRPFFAEAPAPFRIR